MSISPQSGARGLERWYGLLINLYRNGNCIRFWAERCWKYALLLKKLQIKVFRHRILDRKVRKGICVSPPRMELGDSKDDMLEKSECIFPFLYNLIFKPYHLSSPLAPLQKEMDICLQWLFCPKFDAEKLLFEAILGILCIFRSVQPKSECNFPFLYNLIFKPYHLSSP